MNDSTSDLAPVYIDKFGPRWVEPIVDVFNVIPFALRIVGEHSVVAFTEALTSKLKALSWSEIFVSFKGWTGH